MSHYVVSPQATVSGATAHQPASAAQVDVDLPCRRCGYNLRTCAVQGRCPECGLPVRRTLCWRNWRSAERGAVGWAALAWIFWFLTVAFLGISALLGVGEALRGRPLIPPMAELWRAFQSLYRPLLIAGIGAAVWLLWPAFGRLIPIPGFARLGRFCRWSVFFLAGLELAWTGQVRIYGSGYSFLKEASFWSVLILFAVMFVGSFFPPSHTAVPARSRRLVRWSGLCVLGLFGLAAGVLMQASVGSQCFLLWPVGYELLFRWLPVWLVWWCLAVYLEQVVGAVGTLGRIQQRFFRLYVWVLPSLMIAFEVVPLVFYWILNTLPDWRFMRLVRYPAVNNFWWLWEAAVLGSCAVLHALALSVSWPVLPVLYRAWRKSPPTSTDAG